MRFADGAARLAGEGVSQAAIGGMGIPGERIELRDRGTIVAGGDLGQRQAEAGADIGGIEREDVGESRAGRLEPAALQGARRAVGPVVELGHGGEHAIPGFGLDGVETVGDTAHGLGGDAGLRCDIGDGCRAKPFPLLRVGHPRSFARDHSRPSTAAAGDREWDRQNRTAVYVSVNMFT